MEASLGDSQGSELVKETSRAQKNQIRALKAFRVAFGWQPRVSTRTGSLLCPSMRFNITMFYFSARRLAGDCP